MQRRRFLSGITATCALALTGCLSDGGGPAATDGTPDDTPTDSPTPTAEPTDDPDADPSTGTDTGEAPGDTVSGTDWPDGTPSDTDPDTPASRPRTTDGGTGVSDTSLEVTDGGCGQQTDEADVSFDESAGTVTVTGTIWGNDLAYTARLESATLEGDELVVAVVSERRSETETAGQCIAEIDYEATVSLSGSLPVSVVVRHRHGDETTTVTDVTR